MVIPCARQVANGGRLERVGHLERHESVHAQAGHRSREARRADSHHRQRRVVQPDAAIEDAGVATELPLPEAVGQHHDGIPFGRSFAGRVRESAERWTNAECAEVVPGDQQRRHLERAVARSHGGGRLEEGQHIAKRGHLFAEPDDVLVVQPRHVDLLAVLSPHGRAGTETGPDPPARQHRVR